MKKLTLLLLITVTAFTYSYSQKFKYGHIDGNAVYGEMPEKQEADTLYAKFVKQLEDQIKNMQDEYNAKLEEYKQKEASLSDIVKQTKIDELNSLGERIQKFQVSAQTEAAKKQKELYDPVREKFGNALKKVAEKYGYRFIIDKNALLYYNDADDVTDLVKKELGIK
ncbi:MAG: OmpH family outer membrane protein [Chlorobi bacterium]|nr:OmpH family outer membrane protein [Chlorobiota bacterium]